MPRLPKPGGDSGNWGDILNEYLSVSLSADGSLKPGIITKDSFGLDSVDNTSDLDKPVSQATQDALSQKVSGPVSALENSLARFDGSTGKILKASGITIDDNGTLTASPATGFIFTLQPNANAQWASYSNNAGGRGQFRTERYRGTQESPQAVVNNDYVLSLAGRAYDGSAVQQSAGVDIFVDGTPISGASVPMRIGFTTGTNANDRAERLTIKSDGKIGIGTNFLPAKLTINSTTYGNNQSGGLSLTAVNNNVARWEMYYRLNSDANGGPRQAFGFVNRDAAGTTTYSSEHLSIQYDGKVGINTIAPTHTLTLPSSSSGIALYNTADQTTNFERLRFYWSANTAIINTEIGGTGTGRSLRIGTQNRNLTINDAPSYSNGVYQYLQFTGIQGVSMLMHGTKSHSAGTWVELSISPTIAQSSTAGYTALLVNPSESSVGSGARHLADFQVNGISKTRIDHTGSHVFSSGAGITLFNTADELTNVEKFTMGWSGNIFSIQTDYAGTGQGRTLRLASTRGITSSIELNNYSSPQINLKGFTSSSASAVGVLVGNFISNASSGSISALSVAPTINQSGSAGYNGILVNVIESSVGSGERLLADLQVGGSSRFKVASSGLVTVANRIANVSDPTANQDAATKSYVDNQTTNAADAAPYSSVAWSGAISLTPNVAHTYNVSITDNSTLALNASSATKSFMITCVIQQDATGSRTLTISGVKWPYGSAPALSTAANATDVLHFFWTGTQWLGMAGGLGYA